LLQAAVGAAVKPGIFGKLWSATEIARKANHAVCYLLTFLLRFSVNQMINGACERDSLICLLAAVKSSDPD